MYGDSIEKIKIFFKEGKKMEDYELFLRFPEFKTRAITLSFDDGSEHDRKMLEIINKYGIKCTFNLCTGRVKDNEYRIQFEEFGELYKGHEIASHTYTHPHLDTHDLGGVAFQIVKDREKLEEVTEKIIDGFAYPFGLTETEGMVDTIRNCGIKYARTTIPTYNFALPNDFMRWNPTCHQGDKKLYELAERFFMPDDIEHPWRIRPQIFYIWGHSYEYADNWQSLEKMCETIGKKENVWYATNMEIYNYISAFKSLRRSANGKIIHNPTDVDVFVSVDNKNVLLEKNKTVILD